MIVAIVFLYLKVATVDTLAKFVLQLLPIAKNVFSAAIVANSLL